MDSNSDKPSTGESADFVARPADHGSVGPEEQCDAIHRAILIKDAMVKPRSHSYFSVLEDLLRTFTPGERLFLYILSSVLAISAISLLVGVNKAVSVVVPARGGSLTEGIVGPPRFINPILDISQADEDLTQLVYSGLTRVLPDGSIIPDLAEKFSISEDGTTYTFTLRKTAVFHDGTRITPADVLFTVQSAQNPEIKSPRRADWEGVSASSPDDQTIVFKLQHAYAPFIENTTLGILPKHLWGSISAEEFPFSSLNTHPVGSGPYKIYSSQTDNTGVAQSYTLSSFKQFALHEPYLSKITFLFYQNEESLIKAYNYGSIDSLAGISPGGLASLKRSQSSVMHTPLPRVFGVFFNQGRAPVLADTAVRAALDAAIDKQALVNSILLGYGATLSGPIPPGVLETRPSLSSASATTSAPAYAQKARDILSRGGWTYDETAKVWKKSAKGGSASGGKQTLSISLSTADAPELADTANKVAEFWRAAGVQVNVRVYPISELNTNVIRPRSYDAILFGEVVGRTLDLFAFWHSSQRNDPGLNLAMYANSKADTILANARAMTDRKAREASYAPFVSAIAKDQPAIFLYSPEFIYVVPNALRGVALGALTTPSERFLNVMDWYTETENVWSFFTNDNESINQK
ncbi:MAG: ABC transporter substrate-binding protein [Candidatus Kaiserbacteria bacterium]|nr:ABC transporter substrate-binding protein [Candidatus Kaiserbacteria bacterium]